MSLRERAYSSARMAKSSRLRPIPEELRGIEQRRVGSQRSFGLGALSFCHRVAVRSAFEERLLHILSEWRWGEWLCDRSAHRLGALWGCLRGCQRVRNR